MSQSSIQLSLTGTSAIPIGVTIEYGVELIPTAVIDIDSSKPDNDLLCDPASSWRKEMTLTVKTPKGCLKFDGLFDGISISQTPGDVHYSIVLKSKWQKLIETYARAPGISPNSANVFYRSDVTNMDVGQVSSVYKSLKFSSDVSVSQTGNKLPQFVVDITKALITLQTNVKAFKSLIGLDMTEYYDVMGNDKYQAALKFCLDLFGKISMTAVSGCNYTADAYGFNLIKVITDGGPTMLDVLLAGLSLIDCTILFGNDKAWVVPLNTFLKGDHTQPSFRDSSDSSSTKKTPNVAYPADYNNYILNNSGYKDIYGCYLITGPVSDGATKLPSCQDAGHFIDDKSQATGIYIDELSNYMALPMYGIPALNVKSQTNKQGGIPHCQDGKKEATETQQQITDHMMQVHDAAYQAKLEFGKNLAQIRYYREKYTDRTGSFATEFNPKWVPGTTGSLYTRYPGIWVDFYTANISHRISLSSPTHGTALTFISFNSARTGKDGSIAGVDNDQFFNYDKDKMKSIQTEFISDTTQV